MLPRQQFRSLRLAIRIGGFGTAATAALFLTFAAGQPAAAQSAQAAGSSEARTGPGEPKPAAPQSSEGAPVSFEADRVEYSDKADSVTASGNVVLRREGKS